MLNIVPEYETIVLMMSTAIEAAELLFGKYRRQLLALLLLRPEESFYVRELERLSGIPAGSLHRELTSLAEAGLLRRISHGNQVRYQANRDCPIFEDLANIFRKTTGTATTSGQARLEVKEPVPTEYAPGRAGNGEQRGTSRTLRRLSVPKRVIAATCRKWRIRKFSFFGSVTRDDFRPDSDVDVLVEFRRGEMPSLFGIVDLRDELSAAFGGRAVDVATPAIFGNPIRRKNIERDLECVYEG